MRLSSNFQKLHLALSKILVKTTDLNNTSIKICRPSSSIQSIDIVFHLFELQVK
jgi:hypothetical protein